MEGFLIFCLIVVLLVRWSYIRNRFESIESHLAVLQARLAGQDLALTRLDAMFPREEAVAPPAPRPAAPEPLPIPSLSGPSFAERPSAPPIPPAAPAPAPPRSTEEWETLLGGNWLNKLGVFVLVVGIALALGYSFTRVGPLGRVVTSIALSVAMLVAGAVWERRERYQVFARGLMGGGWAALYITVYAMHAVAAARVIADPVSGFLLLLAVAAGMIVHSLRYRSQTVTGVAYFVAFGTLAITEVAQFPLLTLIPLAVSLLYVAHRFRWPRMVLFGLISTYAICVLCGDTGAPLWQAQAIFVVFWLLFEIFDILHPGSWLLPLNAAGFLGLSILKWTSDAPEKVWILLAASAAGYLASAVARARAREWQGAATLTAALAAAAAFQKLDRQWVASALVVEAELFYLAGVRLGARYLRWLGTALFGLEVGRLLATDLVTLPVAAWVPVSSVDAAVFYANRALFAADSFFGFAAAGMLALVIGNEVPEPSRTIGWLFLGAAAFAVGWWRKLFDFRLQGYLLGFLGVAVAVFEPYQLALGVAAAVGYAVVLCALWSPPDHFSDEESKRLQLNGSLAGSLSLVVLLGRMLSSNQVAPAWAVLALLLLVAARAGNLVPLRWQSYGVAALAFVWWWFVSGTNSVWTGVLVIACFYLAMLLAKRASRERLYYSLLAITLTGLLLYYNISGSMLTVAWGIQGAALLASGFPLRDRVLRLSGLALLLSCILKLFVWDLRHLETLPRILSFIVLGLILLAVSWVYTRYRERVSRYL
ncbi:MAG TPA: DUF2339 domain-containing protein [Bryobacteraceae bacterium]|jgi:uncharacterized membrane protein|nr:DUF2339 domain-containing protein [Bryobacteraceae bacterium]